MRILYEDKHIIVVYKEGNLPVQSKSFSQMDLETIIANYKRENGEDMFVGLINRLDQVVEGIVLIAKTKATASKLSKDMDKNIKKKYYALVHSSPKKDKDKLVNYLKKEKNMCKIVSEDKEGGKRSELIYKTIKTNNIYSLLEVTLITGRFHQIRCQLANMGNPIVGDRKYGNDSFKGKIGLCAYYLSFIHPITKEPMEFMVTPENEAFTLL